jgi:hypothetical protein
MQQNLRRRCWTGFTRSESVELRSLPTSSTSAGWIEEKLLLYGQKYPRPVKFELLES